MFSCVCVVAFVVRYCVCYLACLFVYSCSADLWSAVVQHDHDIPVSVNKHTPPDKNASQDISFESTKSGAGLQFMLLGRMAKPLSKGVCVSQTPVGDNPVVCNICTSLLCSL